MCSFIVALRAVVQYAAHRLERELAKEDDDDADAASVTSSILTRRFMDFVVGVIADLPGGVGRVQKVARGGGPGGGAGKGGGGGEARRRTPHAAETRRDQSGGDGGRRSREVREDRRRRHQNSREDREDRRRRHQNSRHRRQTSVGEARGRPPLRGRGVGEEG